MYSVLCRFTNSCIQEDHRGLVTTSRAFRQYEPGFFKSFTYITKLFKTLVILLESLHIYEKRYTLFSFFIINDICFNLYVLIFNLSYVTELQVFYFSRMCLWDKWVIKCSECTRAIRCLIVSSFSKIKLEIVASAFISCITTSLGKLRINIFSSTVVYDYLVVFCSYESNIVRI